MELFAVLHEEGFEFGQEGVRRRRNRIFMDRLTPDAISNEHLLRYYRFPRCEVDVLIEELRPMLEHQTQRSHAIPVPTQVLATLRFYASGSFQSVVGDVTGLSQSSIRRIVNNVTCCLADLAHCHIRLPGTAQQQNLEVQAFAQIAGFPHYIGLIMVLIYQSKYLLLTNTFMLIEKTSIP